MTEPDAIAVARPASTVLIARDGSSGVEFLLTQRNTRMRFMAGAFVFPGGAVSASDGSDELARHIASAPPSWPNMDDARIERAHAMAAVRETFEEVGVLIGAPPLSIAQLEAMRARLMNGEDFGALLGLEKIALALDALLPLIRWITPRSEPIRFDTRFYVARAPRDQEARHDGTECIALTWRTASASIGDADAGTILMSAPTRQTLQALQGIESVDDLLEHARHSKAPTVEPIMKLIDGVRTVLYPGDPDHPVAGRALAGPTRLRL
ncbi:MAG TPA: hypothetical protein VHZ95_20835 [Polyangiales bacterium]|nr:hypothetical protein [Polyangiales bacterium]